MKNINMDEVDLVFKLLTCYYTHVDQKVFL